MTTSCTTLKNAIVNGLGRTLNPSCVEKLLPNTCRPIGISRQMFLEYLRQKEPTVLKMSVTAVNKLLDEVNEMASTSLDQEEVCLKSLLDLARGILHVDSSTEEGASP